MVMNGNVNWMKLTHKLSLSFSLNLGAPLGTSTCTPKIFTTNLNVFIREEEYCSFMYTMYIQASNNTPAYTYVNFYMVQRVHPLGSKLLGMPFGFDWETHNVIEYTMSFQCPPRFVLGINSSHVAYIEYQGCGTLLGTIMVWHAIITFGAKVATCCVWMCSLVPLWSMCPSFTFCSKWSFFP